MMIQSTWPQHTTRGLNGVRDWRGTSSALIRTGLDSESSPHLRRVSADHLAAGSHRVLAHVSGARTCIFMFASSGSPQTRAARSDGVDLAHLALGVSHTLLGDAPRCTEVHRLIPAQFSVSPGCAFGSGHQPIEVLSTLPCGASAHTT